ISLADLAESGCRSHSPRRRIRRVDEKLESLQTHPLKSELGEKSNRSGGDALLPMRRIRPVRDATHARPFPPALASTETVTGHSAPNGKWQTTACDAFSLPTRDHLFRVLD